MRPAGGEFAVAAYQGMVVPVEEGGGVSPRTLGAVAGDVTSFFDPRLYDPALTFGHEYSFAPVFELTDARRLYVALEPRYYPTTGVATGLLEITIVPEPLAALGGLALIGLLVARRGRHPVDAPLAM